MADRIKQPFGNQLVEGDAWNWAITLPDYPPSAYTLKYVFIGPSKLDLMATTAPDGTDFLVSATGAQTDALTPGTYGWGMLVFDASSNRTELARGTVEVIPDLAAQDAGYDPRTYNERMLSALEALLLNAAARIEDEYQINGRMLRLTDRTKLQAMRDDYYSRVRNEKVQKGELGHLTGTVLASFGHERGASGEWSK